MSVPFFPYVSARLLVSASEASGSPGEKFRVRKLGRQRHERVGRAGNETLKGNGIYQTRTRACLRECNFHGGRAPPCSNTDKAGRRATFFAGFISDECARSRRLGEFHPAGCIAPPTGGRLAHQASPGSCQFQARGGRHKADRHGPEQGLVKLNAQQQVSPVDVTAPQRPTFGACTYEERVARSVPSICPGKRPQWHLITLPHAYRRVVGVPAKSLPLAATGVRSRPE